MNTKQNNEASDMGRQDNACLIAMPFDDLFQVQYHRVIKPSIEELGLVSLRAEDLYARQGALFSIRQAIHSVRLVVADFTGRHPSVLYYAGMAHAIGKPMLIMTRDERDVPASMRMEHYLFYDVRDPFWGETLRASLRQHIERLLSGRASHDPANGMAPPLRSESPVTNRSPYQQDQLVERPDPVALARDILTSERVIPAGIQDLPEPTGVHDEAAARLYANSLGPGGRTAYPGSPLSNQQTDHASTEERPDAPDEEPLTREPLARSYSRRDTLEEAQQIDESTPRDDDQDPWNSSRMVYRRQNRPASSRSLKMNTEDALYPPTYRDEPQAMGRVIYSNAPLGDADPLDAAHESRPRSAEVNGRANKHSPYLDAEREPASSVRYPEYDMPRRYAEEAMPSEQAGFARRGGVASTMMSVPPIAGAWRVVFASEGTEYEGLMNIHQDDGGLSTSMTLSYVSHDVQVVVQEEFSGSISGRKVTLNGVNYAFVQRGKTKHYTLDNFELEVAADGRRMTGKVMAQEIEGEATFIKVAA